MSGTCFISQVTQVENVGLSDLITIELCSTNQDISTDQASYFYRAWLLRDRN